MGQKVAVTKEEKSLSYYKYFERELAPIPEEKLKIAGGSPAAPETLLPFERVNEFLAGTDEGFCQVGYGILPDGTGEVCNTTHMPGVTSEMMDWWFPWHSVGSDLRYKIWDPEDHYFATAYPASKVLDPSVPMNQKTWGVDHYIMEDCGPGPEFLLIHFKNPADFGLDTSIIGSEKCTSLVCGAGVNSGTALMLHKWYTDRDGVTLCSRFWMGYGQRPDGTMGNCLPPGFSLPPVAPQGLFAHNIKEFTNLAAILPELYAEEKNNF